MRSCAVELGSRDVTRATVTVAGGLTLSGWKQGDSSDLARVLLPGPTDSWRSYRSVFEHLPPTIRAIAVSQRGHGDSDKPSSMR